MPFVKEIETEAGKLGIWELMESPEELSLNFKFSQAEEAEYFRIKGDKRKLEYLATRILLNNILNFKPAVGYEVSGKPYLENSPLQISISHSAELVTVLISDRKIGIDVENTKRNIDRVARRFLHPKELEHILTLKDSQQAKILYWSAKEAIFKCSDSTGILFNEQIYIFPFNIKKKGLFRGMLNSTVPFKLWYLFYENNAIVYCVEE